LEVPPPAEELPKLAEPGKSNCHKKMIASGNSSWPEMSSVTPLLSLSSRAIVQSELQL